MKTIDISKLVSTKPLIEIKREIDELLQQNLKDISEKNKTSFAMPLNLQSIICLYASYRYCIPIITTTALFQLYANDLIVIILTLLRSKNLEDKFINECKIILNEIKTKENLLSNESLKFYELLKHNIYDNKLYIPADLW